MAKYKTINDAGEEIEVEAFTPAEVEVKVKEKEEEYNKVIAEKDASLGSLAKEKEDLETKLGITKEDNPNFKILKDALSKKDSEIADIKNTLETDKKSRAVTGIIAKITKGNEELEKKMLFHLENTVAGMKGDTPEDLQKKVDAAYKLSQDYNSQGIFDGGISGGGSGGGGDNKNNAGGVEFTSKEKSLGAKLGITEDDYKKYGSKLK